MKKAFKYISAILIIALFSLTLCSCEYLDEKKESQAVLGENANGLTTIVFKDKTYVSFMSEKGSYEVNGIYYYYDSDNTLYGVVTEPDVPVLLSDFYGRHFYYLKNYDMIEYNGEYWCTESEYAYYLNLYENHTKDKYCYKRNFGYEHSTDKKGLFILNDELQNAIAETFKTEPKGKYDRMNTETLENVESIYLCDETKMFYRYCSNLFQDEDGNYYLSLYVDGQDYENLYEVPAEYTALFEDFYVI